MACALCLLQPRLRCYHLREVFQAEIAAPLLTVALPSLVFQSQESLIHDTVYCHE